MIKLMNAVVTPRAKAGYLWFSMPSMEAPKQQSPKTVYHYNCSKNTTIDIAATEGGDDASFQDEKQRSRTEAYPRLAVNMPWMAKTFNNPNE